jgi:putative tricarboxylic transport membrane protein
MLTSLVGAYSVSNNMFSVWLVFVFGLLGYLLKEFDLPSAPFVLGLVLGPLFEKSLVQTSAIGQGDLTVVFRSPIALTVFALAVAAVVLPKGVAMLRSHRQRMKVDAN